jgi:hypothetical protein
LSLNVRTGPPFLFGTPTLTSRASQLWSHGPNLSYTEHVQRAIFDVKLSA